MATNAAGHLADSLKQKDEYAKGISDRTRTLSLGALVLIWGIFSQKAGDSDLKFDPHSKADLLIVAACAVIVLAFDFFEYIAAYEYRRQQAGEKVWFKRFPYHAVERFMRVSKVTLAVFALLALCAVLWHTLSVPPRTVHADSGVESKFFGTWCGGDPNRRYLCLRVRQPRDQVLVELSSDDERDWIGCVNVTFKSDVELDAWCEDQQTENVWKSNDLVTMHLTIANYKEHLDLYHRP